MEFARHIKILATLGPGSSDPDMIRQLVDALSQTPDPG